MVVAYPDEYGGCHNAVVVVALDSAHLFAVFFYLVEVEFVAGVFAALDIHSIAQGLDKVVYYHWLGGGVGVESPTAWAALSYLLLAGARV